MTRESKIRVVGWGPFRLPGERRRDERAFHRARADMLRARGSFDEQGTPVAVDWDAPAATRTTHPTREEAVRAIREMYGRAVVVDVVDTVVVMEPNLTATSGGTERNPVGPPVPGAAAPSTAEAGPSGAVRVVGKDVVDQKGAKIGSASEVYLDDETGQPEWVTVRTGLLGTRESFVPLGNANLLEDDLHVPVTGAQVKRAPRIDTAGHLTPEEEEELHRYYGMTSGPSQQSRRDRPRARLRRYVVSTNVEEADLWRHLAEKKASAEPGREGETDEEVRAIVEGFRRARADETSMPDEGESQSP